MDFKKLNINVIFISIIALLITFFIYNNNNQNTINVTGECSKKVAKDRVSIILKVKNLDKDPSIATSKSTTTYNKISSFIMDLQKQNPLIEIETSEFNTYDKMEWNQDLKKNVKLGVECIIGLEITSPDMNLVSDILAHVSSFNDVYPNGLNSFVSKDTLKKEQADCLEKAIIDAKSKAIDMAKGVKQKIGKMVSANSFNNISNSNTRISYGIMPKSSSVLTENAMDTFAPSIFSGNADISVNVDATFELK